LTDLKKRASMDLMNFYKISKFRRQDQKILNCMAKAKANKHTGPCTVIYTRDSDSTLPKNLQKYFDKQLVE